MTMRAMQEATFLILTALASGGQHGYGIITDVQQISGGRVQLRPGTLYTALDRLREDELIGVDREEVVDGRLRRYYQLTPAGTKRLAPRAARPPAPAVAGLVSAGVPAGERAGDPRGADGLRPGRPAPARPGPGRGPDPRRPVDAA